MERENHLNRTTRSSFTSWEMRSRQKVKLPKLRRPGNKQRHRELYFSALACKKLGQSEQAQRILDRFIEAVKQPNATANDYFVAAIAERYSGHTEQARQDLHRALQLDPLLWQARI